MRRKKPIPKRQPLTIGQLLLKTAITVFAKAVIPNIVITTKEVEPEQPTTVDAEFTVIETKSKQ